MTAEGDDRLVTIASVYSRSELYALLALLRTNGIFAATVGEGHARVDWPITVALGGVGVQIRAGDVALARELLGGIDRNPYRGPVYSENRILDVILMLLLLLPLGVPPPARIPAAFYFAERSDRGA
jgi:hypothetical protein